MGFGRQDGQFACLDVATGNVRWEFPLDSTASAVAACDNNGDGAQEFVFGTTHGEFYVLADAWKSARVVWKARLPASVGAPVIADVDNDGASEILVSLGDGRICLLRTVSKKS
jgi:outer membrane protein assembly factor BamB